MRIRHYGRTNWKINCVFGAAIKKLELKSFDGTIPGGKGYKMSEGDGEGKSVLSIFFLIITDIVLAAISFFIVLAVALLFDYYVDKLIGYLGTNEDSLFFYIRKIGKYVIVFADCFIVGSFVLRGLIKAYQEMWRSK